MLERIIRCRGRYRISLVSFLYCACSMGCAHYPRTIFCTSLAVGPCSKTAGYRTARLDQLTQIKDSTLLIVTFSGGGTRAAAFAYGILRGLDSLYIPGATPQESMLDRVNIISGVSGGAFTAAHFALFGRGGFREFEEKFLFDQHLWLRLLLGYVLVPQPQKWFAPYFSRSDYVVDQWDHLLFHKKTFGELENRNSGPFLLVNATNLQDMSPFPFIQERFDGLCANLSRVKVARAVGASSAFPGLLAPITLENTVGSPHGRPCGEVALVAGTERGGFAWAERFLRYERESGRITTQSPCGSDEPLATSIDDEQLESHRYIHLIDGGVADNLGICLILRGMEVPESLLQLRELIRRDVQRLVVILVDAGTTSGATPSEREASPGAMDVISALAGNRIQFRSDSVRSDFRSSAPKRIADATGLPRERIYFAPLTLQECSGNIHDPVNSVPTTFGLPQSDVKPLIALGINCLKTEEEIQRFLAEYRMRLPSETPRVASKLPSETPRVASKCGSPSEAFVDTSAITSPIYFAFDKSAITPQGAATLDKKIPWLLCNPGMRIRIEGNSDERGSDEYNLGLGMRHAASAKRYLVNHGISAERFDLVSYGEERPVCVASPYDPFDIEEACWQQNRRDDFRILTIGGNRIVPPLKP